MIALVVCDGNAGALITKLSKSSTGPYGPNTVKWQGFRRARTLRTGAQSNNTARSRTQTTSATRKPVAVPMLWLQWPVWEAMAPR